MVRAGMSRTRIHDALVIGAAMVGIEVRKPSLRMGEGCAAGKRPARRKRERLSLRALESRVPGQGKILEPGAAKSEAREQGRSEERRVGNEWVSKCRFRWAPYHFKKNKTKK